MKRIFVLTILWLAPTCGMVAACARTFCARSRLPRQLFRSCKCLPIAPDFQPAQKPLPELGRVGVDMERQRPLSLREALALALENNKDIEVARDNVKIAEFDLKGARGSLRSQG